MNSGSLRLRLLLAAAASIGLALFLTGFAIVQLFERQVRERVVGDLNDDLLQLVATIAVDADGTVTVSGNLADPRFNQPYGGRYWRVDFSAPGTAATREPLRSRSLWDADLDLRNPVGPEGESLVMVSRRINVDAKGKPVDLWLVVAAHEDEVKRPTGQLRDQLTVALILIGIVLLIGAWLQVTVGLSPLKTLRWQLADVRSGLAERLTGRFPNEVAPLVGELNDVLEMREKSLERARRRAGDLAHGLKTPLTVLSTIARELRRRRLDRQADDIDEQAEAMRRHVEQALARARLSSGRGHSVTLLLPVVNKVIAALRRLPRGEDLKWEIGIASNVSVPLEAGDLTELLGNLLDNARKWAKGHIRIALVSGQLAIEDDGPGVPEADLGLISERGHRLDESKQGSGLGLSIVADIADIYGMAIEYGHSELGGLKVAIRL